MSSCFSKQLYGFAFLAAAHENPNCFTSSGEALGIFHGCNYYYYFFSHSNSEVVSYYGLNSISLLINVDHPFLDWFAL